MTNKEVLAAIVRLAVDNKQLLEPYCGPGNMITLHIPDPEGGWSLVIKPGPVCTGQPDFGDGDAVSIDAEKAYTLAKSVVDKVNAKMETEAKALDEWREATAALREL